MLPLFAFQSDITVIERVSFLRCFERSASLGAHKIYSNLVYTVGLALCNGATITILDKITTSHFGGPPGLFLDSIARTGLVTVIWTVAYMNVRIKEEDLSCAVLRQELGGIVTIPNDPEDPVLSHRVASEQEAPIMLGAYTVGYGPLQQLQDGEEKSALLQDDSSQSMLPNRSFIASQAPPRQTNSLKDAIELTPQAPSSHVARLESNRVRSHTRGPTQFTSDRICRVLRQALPSSQRTDESVILAPLFQGLQALSHIIVQLVALMPL
jgi:hypothetical protein